MIRQVKLPPFEFERILSEELDEPLSPSNFRLQPPLPSDKNVLVIYAREREGQCEQIWLSRRLYDTEAIAMEIEDDDVDAPYDDLQGQFWPSRHCLSVQVISNYTTTNLLTNGKAGVARERENWWHFKDEADLRRLLHDKILPLLLTVGLERFDDRLEDIREGRLLAS